MKKVTSYIFISLFLQLLTITASAQTIHSPDGSIGVTFNLNSGVPEYSVTYNGTAVINPSRLGFRFKTEGNMTGKFSILNTSTDAVDSTWTPVLGQSGSIRNNYNELVVRLQEASGEFRLMNIHFRVFNDGVGFRYELPHQPNLNTDFHSRFIRHNYTLSLHRRDVMA